MGRPSETPPRGLELAAGDFDGDGYDELVVGTPFKNLHGFIDSGVVYVLPGTAGGLGSNNQSWHQGKDGLQGFWEDRDFFGFSLATIPGPVVLFANGFESGDTGSWSSTVP